jgi:hypothetical protein
MKGGSTRCVVGSAFSGVLSGGGDGTGAVAVAPSRGAAKQGDETGHAELLTAGFRREPRTAAAVGQMGCACAAGGEKRCRGPGENVSGLENAGQHRRQPGRGGCVSGGQTGRGYASGGRSDSGVGVRSHVAAHVVAGGLTQASRVGESEVMWRPTLRRAE